MDVKAVCRSPCAIDLPRLSHPSPLRDSFVLPYLHKYHDGLLCCITPRPSSHLSYFAQAQDSPLILVVTTPSMCISCHFSDIYGQLFILYMFSVDTNTEEAPPASAVVFNLWPSPVGRTHIQECVFDARISGKDECVRPSRM